MKGAAGGGYKNTKVKEVNKGENLGGGGDQS